MRIVSVGRALPDNYYEQAALLDAFRELWGARFHNPARLEQIHQNVLVGGRHLALPLPDYRELTSFTQTNDAFISCAVELGARALRDAAERADLPLPSLGQLLFASSTGIATPSIDARLVNRLRLAPGLRRTPIFGLGCMAGAGGVARLTDLLRANPQQAGALVSVELCSLTLQRQDVSLANIISSGLFGDGSAALMMVGAEHPLADRRDLGPRVLASRSIFYPDSEEVMGWQIGSDGFRVVLSADVPKVVQEHVRADIDAFLDAEGLKRSDLSSYVMHPGGPKVLSAFEEALALEAGELELSWKTLAELGNLSSASVLMVLRDLLDGKGKRGRPPAGSPGLMMAMGPGFCSELLLLEW